MTRVLIALLALLAAAAPARAQEPVRALLFSHSTGYRHASIEPGVAAIRAMAEREGIDLVASEDPAVFDSEALADTNVLILLSTVASLFAGNTLLS